MRKRKKNLETANGTPKCSFESNMEQLEVVLIIQQDGEVSKEGSCSISVVSENRYRLHLVLYNAKLVCKQTISRLLNKMGTNNS